MGLKQSGPAMSTNQIFRTVLPLANVTAITAGQSESTATQAGTSGLGLNLFSNIYNDANFATQIAAKYSSIMIKGFSVTRLILGNDLTLAQSEVTSPA